MKKLVSDDIKYDRIFFMNDDTLVKYSMVDVNAWKSLQNKNMNFINTPTDIFNLDEKELEKYPLYHSKIYLPFLHDYDTLYGSKIANTMDTKDALLLFKKNLLLLKEMHSKDVFHSDVYYKNIMINEDKDLKFIDLDASIIDDYVSDENIYLEDDISLLEKKNSVMVDDKVDLLAVYFNYLVDGKFDLGSDRYINLSKLSLNCDMTSSIKSYLEDDTIPSEDYYFLDIIDALLDKGYESPNILLKKK